MRADQVEPHGRASRTAPAGSERRAKPQHGGATWIDRLVDWFIPPEIAAERETRQRARMFLISHICGPFIGNTIPLALAFFDPTPGYPVAVLAASITLFWVFPFLLRAFGHYNLLALLSVQNLIFCILWSCHFYGGVSSPTLPWVLTIPLLAFFYLGSSPKLRAIVIVLGAVNLVGFFLLEMFGPKVFDDTPSFALQGLGIVSTVAASLYVTMMAVYYSKILASGVELEAEMKGHLATAEELRRATAESERAGLAKSEFVARMSHELRTPLNAVIGYSEILLENAEGEEDVEDLEKIHTSGKHLLRLVNEVLDLSKIEAGKMELLPETLEVAGFITATVDNCRPLATKKGNKLSLEIKSDVGSIVIDGHKLRRVLVEMMDNACKFTENGEVTVSVERTSASGRDEVLFRTRDTGAGIPQDNLADLFERFSVGGDSSASKYGGTGLGLALNYELCRLMGGDITVESTVGQGSCFTVRVPASPPAGKAKVDQDDDVDADAWTEEELDETDVAPVADAA